MNYLRSSCGVFAVIWLSAPDPIVAQNPSAPIIPAPVQAPQNPQFVRYVDAARRGSPPLLQSSSGHFLGLIPEPVDLSHLKSQPNPLKVLRAGQLPASYDLRSSGRISPVRDQGNCGSCWTFGTYGSMESVLMPAEGRDFSENNMKNLHGFDLPPCAGGNSTMAAAYLVRWAGPVNESADPYHPTDSNTSPAGLSPEKHVQRVIIIPGRTGPLDNGPLKNAIVTYGAIETSMYIDGANFNDTQASYYYDGSSSQQSNHSVTLAGWDDNYSRHNFGTTPPGDGAFLIKNSWGTYWGQSGYFWISYYDAVYAYGDSWVYVGNESVENYSHKYEYDPLGWVTSWGYGNTTAWFANVFTSVAAEPLRAVSFYAASNNSSYTIYAYTNANSGPISGSLGATTSGTVPLAGYVTVALSSPVSLTNGMKFSIVVALTTPDYAFPVAAELKSAGYSSAATASPGQSYISPNGTYWVDMTTYSSTANVCLKAFTASTTLSALAISKSHVGDFSQGQAGATYTVNVSNQPGASPTSGAVTVTEITPSGLNLVSMAGSGWACYGNACTRTDSLAAGASYPPITVAVDVAVNAPAQLTNQVMASGGGSTAATANDVTTISPLPAAPVLLTPLNGAVNVPLSAILSWSPSAGASSYDVFIGTSANPAFAWNTAVTRYTPRLNLGTVYYWRVAARNASGSATSDTYAFTTLINGPRPPVHTDFDGNGVPDLLWQSEATRQIVVDYYGGPSGATVIGWNWLYPGLGAGGWHVRAIADFNQDRVPDLVWQNDSTRQVTVHYYGGPGGATDLAWNWLYSDIAPGWHIVAAADFNSDGFPDLVWQNDTTRQVTVHYYGGAGGAVDVGWSWLYASTGAAGWRVVAAADFNRDGVPDLVWQNDATSQVTVHYYGGFGGATDLGWNWLYASTGAVGWHIAMAADFNSDGSPDLVWQNTTTGQATVHYYGGSGGAVDLGWNWLYAENIPGWSVLY